jgi:cobalamin biosynthesis Mg chelatase CobN
MEIIAIWDYREGVIGPSTFDLVGYRVEALDGSIGKVDAAAYEAGAAYLVVDTGPWIFGKKVMLPAGVVQSVDQDEEIVYVNRTKEQIKNAPEFDESLDDAYRDRLGTYYGPEGKGYRAPQPGLTRSP